MKNMFVLLLLLFLPLQTTHAKLQVTYHQVEAQIVKVQSDGTILCEDGSIFKQANNQAQSIELDLGQIVYIKYFILLKENYYVAISSKNSGPFDLSPAMDLSLDHAVK